jgi:hypothetical protein
LDVILGPWPSNIYSDLKAQEISSLKT